MNIGFTAVTTEIYKIINDDFSGTSTELESINEYFRNALSEFAGKNAGICYMSDKYDSGAVSDKEKAMKRFERTIRSTHHSIADHCKVTVLFEDVPKIFAMIMNSFQDYATSEKSARYTIMSNLTDRENTLYTKWILKIKDILMTKYGVDDKNANKLAMENARYFISIFSPATTFSYTTSIRQWNYINIWFKEIIELYLGNEYPASIKDFMSKLIPWLTEFSEMFEGTFIYNELITEPKSRRVDFIPQLYPDTQELMYQKEIFSDAYCMSYFASFSCLAQLQRHRSIKYVIGDIVPLRIDNIRYFIPKFLTKELADEWMSDMLSIHDLYPQAIMVRITELGTIDKFLLKCDERLCGRAQYETMDVCADSLIRFHQYQKIPYFGGLSSYFEKAIDSWIVDGSDNSSSSNTYSVSGYSDLIRLKAKCQMKKDGCADKSGCLHGSCNATNRKF